MLGTKVGYVFRRHPGIILLLLFFITSEDSIKVLKKTYTINHTLVSKQAYIESQYIACKRIPHMPLNSCAWNVDQWLYNAICSSYTVYLSLAQPAMYFMILFSVLVFYFHSFLNMCACHVYFLTNLLTYLSWAHALLYQAECTALIDNKYLRQRQSPNGSI